MRFPIPMQITDPNSVLCDVDQHQVENMIWLRLAPMKELIGKVKFEIVRLPHGKYESQHVVKFLTTLKSGYVVETTTTKVSKGAALIASVDQMKARVEKRARLESGWLYRSLKSIKQMANSLVQIMGVQSRMDSRSESIG